MKEGVNMTERVIDVKLGEQGVLFEASAKQRKNEQYLSKPDDAMEDLINNGGYEYLGKDENGRAMFGNIPVKASI